MYEMLIFSIKTLILVIKQKINWSLRKMDPTSFCWLSDKDSMILSNNQDKTVHFHHIVVPTAEHK